MASVVHYKFKSALLGDSVSFDGDGISVRDLICRIAEKKGLVLQGDVDLVLFNADSHQEYIDQTCIIPKDTHVLVKKTSLKAQLSSLLKWGETMGVREACVGQTNDLWESQYDPLTVDQGEATQQDHACWTEAEEAACHSAQQNSMRSKKSSPAVAQAQSDGRSSVKPSHPPSSYVCQRCELPGHWKRDCPTWGDKAYDPKKHPTGIPSMNVRFISLTEAVSSEEGALYSKHGRMIKTLTREEDFMRATTKEAHAGGVVNQDGSIPKELQCSMTKELILAPHVLPCCQSNVSFPAAYNHLIDTNSCPICMQQDVCMQDLQANSKLNKFLEAYLQRALQQGVRVQAPSKFVKSGMFCNVSDMENTNPEHSGHPANYTAAALLRASEYWNALGKMALDGSRPANDPSTGGGSDYKANIKKITGRVTRVGTGSFFVGSRLGRSDVLISGIVLKKAFQNTPDVDSYTPWVSDVVSLWCRALKIPRGMTRYHAFQIEEFQSFTASGTVVNARPNGDIHLRTFCPATLALVPFCIWKSARPLCKIGDSLTVRIRSTESGYVADEVVSKIMQCTAVANYMGSNEIVVRSTSPNRHEISLAGVAFTWVWKQSNFSTDSTINVEYVESPFGKRNFRATRLLQLPMSEQNSSQRPRPFEAGAHQQDLYFTAHRSFFPFCEAVGTQPTFMQESVPDKDLNYTHNAIELKDAGIEGHTASQYEPKKKMKSPTLPAPATYSEDSVEDGEICEDSPPRIDGIQYDCKVTTATRGASSGSGKSDSMSERDSTELLIDSAGCREDSPPRIDGIQCDSTVTTATRGASSGSGKSDSMSGRDSTELLIDSAGCREDSSPRIDGIQCDSTVTTATRGASSGSGKSDSMSGRDSTELLIDSAGYREDSPPRIDGIQCDSTVTTATRGASSGSGKSDSMSGRDSTELLIDSGDGLHGNSNQNTLLDGCTTNLAKRNRVSMDDPLILKPSQCEASANRSEVLEKKSEQVSLKRLRHGHRDLTTQLPRPRVAELPKLWTGDWVRLSRLSTVSLHVVYARQPVEINLGIVWLKSIGTLQLIDSIDIEDDNTWKPSTVLRGMPTLCCAVISAESTLGDDTWRIPPVSMHCSEKTQPETAGRVLSTDGIGNCKVSFLLPCGTKLHQAICPGLDVPLLAWWFKE